MTSCMYGLVVLMLTGAAAEPPRQAGDSLPEVRVKSAGTRIDHSCRVVIEPGAVIPGTDAGVIQIDADGITVEFADGSILRGAPPEQGLDTLTGTGIRVKGHTNVTLRNLSIAGYKAGVHCTHASGLTIDGARVLSGRAMRLKSTPLAEDASDWLWPHKNDNGEWLANYGAGVCVEDSAGVTLQKIRVRHAQNGVLLSRVLDSKIFDNDCSFLSGWGIAMWRSSRNVVTRNAVDFCVRGYSHGAYNRGQDSAGFLVFEQCSNNVFAENSATHCGDAFFGFAGRDALGEGWMEEQRAALRTATGKDSSESIAIPESVRVPHKRAGCNDNLLIENDFSFAAAHGIEMTFSFGNKFIGNRISGNAICGIWGGFSAGTLISGNMFQSNGSSGYGEERGGINIEHGRDNRIVSNTFANNAAGVRLWAKADSPLAHTPWGMANGEPVAGGGSGIPSARNVIADNVFDGDRAALIVRNCSETVFSGNASRNVGKEIDAEPGAMINTKAGDPIDIKSPEFTALGATRPVGARTVLDGRENIIMGLWGPWDFETPMVRMSRREPVVRADVHEVFGAKQPLDVESLVGECRVVVVDREASSPPNVSSDIRVEAGELGPGVWPYVLRVRTEGFDQRVVGVIVNAEWNVTVFPWTHDPIKDLEGWRAEAKGGSAIAATCRGIEFPFGYKGPSKAGISPAVDAAKLGANHHGLIARTTLALRAGSWAVRTLSDDGIRVIADGKTIIERWDIHVPTADRGVITVDTARSVELEVEYFQNDGFAVLSVSVEPAGTAP